MGITWHRRDFSSGRAFLFLMFCAFLWTVTFTLEIGAQSLQLKLLMVKFQFIAIAFLPLAWLYLIFSYIGYVRPWKDWFFLSVIPAITNMIIWFVPQPNWFWKEPRIMSGSASLTIMDYDYGFWFYYVHVPYSYILMFIALITLVRTLFKVHAIYRHQIIIMIIAVLLPTITDILYVFGYSPIRHFNFTTAVFSISCLIIAWALFRYSFLDLLPMARDVVIENMEDGVIVLDVKNRIVDVNPSAIMITGISLQDIGRPVSEIFPGLVDNRFGESCYKNKNQIEIKMRNTNEIRVFDLRLSLIRDHIGRVQGSVVTLRDYTERAKLFNQIREQAIYDDLTGIYNRRHFFELGQKGLNLIKKRPDNFISVMMLDIDKYKAINDRYGHAVGDQVLIAFAKQCKNSIRTNDIFGRLGGDEFAIILPDTAREDALIVAGRIKKSVEDMCIAATRYDHISITVSLGIVTAQSLDASELQLEQLLSLADEAMYASKKQGGIRSIYLIEKGRGFC